MKIENENTFLDALQNGIGLFVGAGFSVLAKDRKGRSLPVAGGLLKSLNDHFDKHSKNLEQLSTILETTRSSEFNQFLRDRFTVASFDTVYYNLFKIAVKKIYTTNIDNLIYRIYKDGNSGFYLHSQYENGSTDDANAIDYLTLHGNVEIADSKFIFSSSKLANIYDNAPRMWDYLSKGLEHYPTLFVGYSLNDTSVIQALTSRRSSIKAQKDKWIMLLEEDEDAIDYFKSLGFKIIIGNTRELLEWINSHVTVSRNVVQKGILSKLFARNLVPRGLSDVTSTRPINEFFKGAVPTWNDIISNNIYKTSHYSTIQDSILDRKKNTIIIGAPGTGKTTLMMQVAYGISYKGAKLRFENITSNFVDYLVKVASGEQALIFIDNFSDNIDAFLKLCSHANFRVVGADRGHNYGFISHMIDEDKFNVINVTDMNEFDIQGIFDSLPADLRRKSIRKNKDTDYQDDSIFDFVLRNINVSNLKARYKEVLTKLDDEHSDLAEFLVLCSYAHYCRIPLSSEMAFSYFSDTYNPEGVYELRRQLGDLLEDYDIGELSDYYDNMDYYYPRSFYIAESILDGAPKELLRRVMENVLIMIRPVQICHFNVFKRYAFDKDIVQKAFTNWHDGKKFYEDAFTYDYNNPYILQQGALYLSAKHQHKEAFAWIDRALVMTNDKRFSIRNSHAIIMFNANISSSSDQAEKSLIESMEILEECYLSDIRKAFHAITFAKQSIEFYKRSPGERASSYLEKASKWLGEEKKNKYALADLKKLQKEINDILAL